jgi:hypothetical protein
MTTETMPAKAPEYVSDDADMKAFKRGWNALHDAITARRSAASAEPAVGYVSQATLTFFREGIAVGSTILAKPLGDASIPLYAACSRAEGVVT